MAASNTRFTQNSLGQSKTPIDSDHGIYRDHRAGSNPALQQSPAVPLACYPLDEPGGAPIRFRTFQVCPKDLPAVRWHSDRAEIGASVYDRRRSTMNEQAVQERWGRSLNIAEVAVYSVLVLLVTLLSVYVPA
jgi:hypothetical protein